MFRPDRAHLNPSGLSRQSSKIYKTVRQKSNADLDKTLKQLKIEHKASISRILREEYTLKNAQNSMKPREFFTGEVQMDSHCERHEQNVQEGKIEYITDDKSLILEKPALVSKMVSCRPNHTREQHKKRHSFHLPSIMEESTRCFLTQKTKNTQLEKPLPALYDTNNPSRSREHSEEHSERYRSKTISIPDETRKSPCYVMRNDGRFAFNTRRKDRNSLEKDNDLSPQGLGEEMLLNCRYLRRSYSSPNVFDIESFTKK